MWAKWPAVFHCDVQWSLLDFFHGNKKFKSLREKSQEIIFTYFHHFCWKSKVLHPFSYFYNRRCRQLRGTARTVLAHSRYSVCRITHNCCPVIHKPCCLPLWEVAAATVLCDLLPFSDSALAATLSVAPSHSVQCLLRGPPRPLSKLFYSDQLRTRMLNS